jgi:teichuronic acid biosynthesis glycosyltransferase TuaC
MSEPTAGRGAGTRPRPGGSQILFVVESYSASPRFWGGVQVTLRNLVVGLAGDEDLVVLAPRLMLPPLPRYRAARRERRLEDAAGRAAPPPAGVVVLRPPYLHFPLVHGLTEPLQLLVLGLWTVLFRARHVRLIHGHRARPMGVLAVQLGALLRRPAVISVYGSEVHTNVHGAAGLAPFWIRYAMRRAACVIGVSRDLLEQAQALGVPPARCRFIPSGVDLESFVPRDAAVARRQIGLPADRRAFLCIGRFRRVKGHAVLVEAFRELCRRRDDALLVLMSDGPLRPEIEAAVRAHGLADQVRFPGVLESGLIPLYMAAADALVLPSFNEGMPLCVIESFACGRPVVATAVGGTPELITESRYGLLVPPGDPAALATALDEALKRTWDPAALRERAEEFGWPRIVERLRAVYREVAGA